VDLIECLPANKIQARRFIESELRPAQKGQNVVLDETAFVDFILWLQSLKSTR
jgi:hypothetical protein